MSVRDLKQLASRYSYDDFVADKEKLKLELFDLKRAGVDLKLLNAKRTTDWSPQEHRAQRLDVATRDLQNIHRLMRGSYSMQLTLAESALLIIDDCRRATGDQTDDEEKNEPKSFPATRDEGRKPS